MTRQDILFLVEQGNAHFLTFASNREDAKRKALPWLGQNPDKYTVSPLTEPGDRIHAALTLSI